MKKNNAFKFIIFIFAALCCIFSVATVSAQEQQYESTHLSREELTEILKSGDVLSLEKIIETIARDHDDRMLEVELLNYDGVLIYQIEVLKADGVVVTYFLDGKTGDNASHLLED
jgi:uncharacterized membrane protein YkoI